MSPYRASRRAKRTRDAPSTGVVADMVRQFADKYAFLRELVQNSIDAGATCIRVEVDRQGDGGVLTSVLDDGAGMTAETIESALLTLFSSTKEDGTGAIGKYGVGFVSVLALEPDEVTVETWRDGASWRLRLFADHNWELAPMGERPGQGTRVTLTTTASGDEYDEHVAAVRASLGRWCRHARVPIELALPAGAMRRSERLDTPLDVDAPIRVRVELDDEVYVLGLSSGAPSASFFGRGLTLLETSERFAGLDGICVAIDSPRLGHTLSRDDVRRDASFDAVLGQARRIAKQELHREARERLRSTAAATSRGREAREYAEVLALCQAAPFELSEDDMVYPLCHEVSGKLVMSTAELERARAFRRPALFARQPDALTLRLAAADKPVVLAGCDYIRRAFSEHFAARGAADAHDLFVLFEPLVLERDESEFVERLARTLQAAGIACSSVVLAKRTGALAGHVGVFTSDPLDVVFDTSELLGKGTRGDTLILDGEHDLVKVARSLARNNPLLAAHLLVRLVCLEVEGTLPRQRNRNLLHQAARDLER